MLLPATLRRAAPAEEPLLARACLRVWSSPALAGLAALAGYVAVVLTSKQSILAQSIFPYYVYLAHALLHGQLALIDLPANTHDLTIYQGHYYLYWAPLPALLYMPWVVLFGPGVSDVPLHLAMGALSVALIGVILKALADRQLVPLTTDKRAWLTAGFAFGTVQLYLATHVGIHFSAQVFGFTLCCAAYAAALTLPRRWAPLVAGTLVGCTFLTRSPTALACIWIGWLLYQQRDRSDHFAVVRLALAGLTPLAVAVGLLGAYNYLRFGHPLETGYNAYQDMGPMFAGDFARYGLFNLHYLSENLYYNFVAHPFLALFGPDPITNFFMGGSLFLMSPIFFLAIPGLVRAWRSQGWVLALTLLVGILPFAFHIGTGFATFGPRYTLDFTVPLLIATAIGVTAVSTRVVAYLTMIGVATYLLGTLLVSLLG